MSNSGPSESGGRRNRCEICGLIFGDSYALTCHKSIEHGQDKKSTPSKT
jgi:hypothetical protein